MCRCRPMLWIGAAIAVFGVAPAQAMAPKGPQYADPAKTDADFAFQGDYAGTFDTDRGKRKSGAQVIALGGGEFRAVRYPGGLPGDGWNGKEKYEIEGVRGEDGVRFENENNFCLLKDGVLTVFKKNGDEISRLKRVARRSPTEGKKPPANAVVLFDGANADAWVGGRMTDDGLLMEGATSKQTFQSQQLHIEFRLPYQPQDRGQARGNSGVYLQGRYEVQMLDSFGLEGADNECGGIYQVKAPDVNMCFPPLSWQTYDIEFTAANYDDQGNLAKPARITVRHNGVLIHKDVELPAEKTRAAPVDAGPEPGPVYLQNHGCPVRYRNIWVIPTL